MPSDQNEEMEVKYRFSHEDYLRFIDFWVRRNRRHYARQIVRVFVLLLVGYVALLLLSNVALPFALGLGAILATICTGSLIWVRRQRMRRVREHVLGERTTRIGPEGVFGRFPQFEILNYWKGITDIAEDESYLFFFTGGSRAHVVPKRAFATAGSLEQFRDAANSYWKSSRS